MNLDPLNSFESDLNFFQLPLPSPDQVAIQILQKSNTLFHLNLIWHAEECQLPALKNSLSPGSYYANVLMKKNHLEQQVRQVALLKKSLKLLTLPNSVPQVCQLNRDCAYFLNVTSSPLMNKFYLILIEP